MELFGYSENLENQMLELIALISIESIRSSFTVTIFKLLDWVNQTKGVYYHNIWRPRDK